MNILDNAAFEQSLMTELPSFEVSRKGRKSKRRGMKQTTLKRVGSRQLQGKKVCSCKTGQRLVKTYVRK